MCGICFPHMIIILQSIVLWLPQDNTVVINIILWVIYWIYIILGGLDNNYGYHPSYIQIHGRTFIPQLFHDHPVQLFTSRFSQLELVQKAGEYHLSRDRLSLPNQSQKYQFYYYNILLLLVLLKYQSYFSSWFWMLETVPSEVILVQPPFAQDLLPADTEVLEKLGTFARRRCGVWGMM